MKNFLYVFLILFLNQGCNTNPKVSDIPVIDIEKELGPVKILNLKDYAESIHYVKLDTPKEGLLNYIFDLIYEDGLFIMTDRNSNMRIENAKLFHEDGSFVKAIGHIGQGPEEHLFGFGIDYFSDAKEILFQAYQKLFFFDTEGNLKRIKRLDFDPFAVHQILYFFNTETFAADVQSTPDRMLKLLFLNDSLQIIKNFPASNPLVNYNTRSYPAIGSHTAIMYRFKNQLIHYKSYEDTIFSVDKEMNIKAKYIINYGKYKIFGSNYDDLAFSVMKIQESSDFLFFNFWSPRFAPEKIMGINQFSGKEGPNASFLGIYHKKNNKLLFLKHSEKKLASTVNDGGFKNNIDGGLPFWPKYISTRGEMVSYYQPYEFMEAFQDQKNVPEEVKAILKDLKEDDNPIIAIAKLKK